MRFDDTIITISREYGSGGRIIGQRLAQELGIAFYDNELITMAASQTGMSEDFLKKTEERANHSLRFSLSYLGNLSYTMPLNDKVFIAQSQIIRELAEKGPCVIVGRCADFILGERENVLRLYVHAPFEYCVKKAMEVHASFDEEEARRYIRRIDKYRRDYYRYFTGRDWNAAENYDLCINSSMLGWDKCVALVKAYLEIKMA